MPAHTGAPASGPLGAGGLSPYLNDLGKMTPSQVPRLAVEAESLFLGQLLEQMRKAMVHSVNRRQGARAYQSLADQHFARALAAAGGLGLGRKIADDLAPRLAAQGEEVQNGGKGTGARSRNRSAEADPPAPGTAGVPGERTAGPGGGTGGGHPLPGGREERHPGATAPAG
ncbi:MAG: hypothetical protein FJ128_00660 [Deltaproteobacteria bacterium]|nr:hypothetical protein [Deltaproteobacteria bacterium]